MASTPPLHHILQELSLTIVMANALDYASINGITSQVPLAARVALLKTMADDGWNTYEKVQPLKQARETLVEMASQGLPGAYIEERDSFTHSLQVAIPPCTTTCVVQFQVPFTPNEEVDQVKLDVSILDINHTRDVSLTTLAPPMPTSAVNSTTTIAAPTVPEVTEGTDFHLNLYLPNITFTWNFQMRAIMISQKYWVATTNQLSFLRMEPSFKTAHALITTFFPNDVVSMPKNIVSSKSLDVDSRS